MHNEAKVRRKQEDHKHMVGVWERSLRLAQEKIDKEPDPKKKKDMYGQLEYSKSRLAFHKGKV